MLELPGHKADRVTEWIWEKALGVPLILDQAPTAALPLITENQLGYFGGKFYFMIGGVLKEFSVSNTA